MSRVTNQAVVDGVTTAASGLSGATTGNKLTYTCPAGRQSKVSLIQTFNFAGGAPTVALIVVSGANTITVSSGTVPAAATGPYFLNAGDVVTIRVNVLAVGSTFDGMITAEEYLAS